MPLAACMLVALNKPFNVLCQFTDSHVPPRLTLAEFVKIPDVYPAGRLDFDSEGLLLLTDDGRLGKRLTDPRHQTEKTYFVQVEGEPRIDQLSRLRKGILLNDGMTLPAQAVQPDAVPAWLWPRTPPVRFRKTVPDTWLELTIREGRNRQVRRMIEAVGSKVVELVRTRIGSVSIGDLAPGAWRELKDAELALLGAGR